MEIVMENPKPTHRDRETGMFVVVTPAVRISAPWAERPDWYMDAADAIKCWTRYRTPTPTQTITAIFTTAWFCDELANGTRGWIDYCRSDSGLGSDWNMGGD